MDEKDTTDWISELRDGDRDRAAEVIWGKYFDKLVRLARRWLQGMPRRSTDEEDVALSAMESFMRGVTEKREWTLEDRTALSKLLVTITARKANAARRRHMAKKRGGGAVRGDSAFPNRGSSGIGNGLAAYPDGKPTPEFVASLADTMTHCFDKLGDDTLRKIAKLKLEGYTNEEIAGELGCSKRAVIRKFNLVREILSEEAES